MDIREQGVLCMILAGAGWTDLCCGRVDNRWLILGALAGICCRRLDFLAAAAVMIIPGFCLFRFRMMGAGDGKLMAIIAGYLGLTRGAYAIAAGFAVGAVWSLSRFWRGRSFRARLNYFFAYFMRIIQEKKIEKYDKLADMDRAARIPLAACLAVGVYLYLAGCAVMRGRM